MRKVILILFLAQFLYVSCRLQSESVPVQDHQRKLTLMVYMSADNDLERYALENLKAMEKADSSNISVLVLLDRSEGYDETNGDWTDTRLFEVVHDSGNNNSIKSKRLKCLPLGLTTTEQTELDLGNPAVLHSFIEYGKKNYKAENYALIIWGHGSGWKAFSIDDRSRTYMTVKQLGDAVRDMDLSVIGFDTCFGGVLENLYELKDCADFTVACPGIAPKEGWDYRNLLEELSHGISGNGTKGRSGSAENIARIFAKNGNADNTIYRNEKLGELFSDFDAFSQELAESVTDPESQLETLKTLCACKSYCYSQNPCDIYLDAKALALIYSQTENENLKSKASTLSEKINESCLTISQNDSEIGIHFIPKSESGNLAPVHSIDYVQDMSRSDQSAFIRQSKWWVPSVKQKSESLLDKLFYTSF